MESPLCKELVITMKPMTRAHEPEANARLIAAAPALLEEHRAWARDFGAALLLFLQGDDSAINNLAYDMAIDQDNEGPVLRSPTLDHAVSGREARGIGQS